MRQTKQTRRHDANSVLDRKTEKRAKRSTQASPAADTPLPQPPETANQRSTLRRRRSSSESSRSLQNRLNLGKHPSNSQKPNKETPRPPPARGRSQRSHSP